MLASSLLSDAANSIEREISPRVGIEASSSLDQSRKLAANSVQISSKLAATFRQSEFENHLLVRIQAGQSARDRMIGLAAKAGITNPRDITQAIIDGKFVPPFDELVQVHAEFGLPPESYVSESYKKELARIGQDWRTPSNMQPWIDRWRDEQLIKSFGKIDEKTAFLYGQRTFLFDKYGIPTDPNLTLQKARETLRGKDLESFNRDISYAQRESILGVYSMSTLDPNDPWNLRTRYEDLRRKYIQSLNAKKNSVRSDNPTVAKQERPNPGEDSKPDSPSRFIGIQVAPFFQFGEPKGALVIGLSPKADARKVLKVGDIVIGVTDYENAILINNPSELISFLRAVPKDKDTVALSVVRGDDIETKTIRFVTLPSSEALEMDNVQTPCSFGIYSDRNGYRIAVIPVNVVRRIFEAELERTISQAIDFQKNGLFHTLDGYRFCQSGGPLIAVQVPYFGTPAWELLAKQLQHIRSSGGGSTSRNIVSWHYDVDANGPRMLPGPFYGEPPNITLEERISHLSLFSPIAEHPKQAEKIPDASDNSEVPARKPSKSKQLELSRSEPNPSVPAIPTKQPVAAFLLFFSNALAMDWGDELICKLKNWSDSSGYESCYIEANDTLVLLADGAPIAAMVGGMLGWFFAPLWIVIGWARLWETPTDDEYIRKAIFVDTFEGAISAWAGYYGAVATFGMVAFPVGVGLAIGSIKGFGFVALKRINQNWASIVQTFWIIAFFALLLLGLVLMSSRF